MRSINGLLSLLEIKLSNMKNSNNTRNVSVTFAISMIILSMISISDLAAAPLISSQDDMSVLSDTSRTHDNKFNPKAECNEPIDIKNVSSSSNIDNNNDEEINAQSAFDNNEDTEWSEDKVGAYLDFDIGTIRSICDVEILWDEGDERSYNFLTLRRYCRGAKPVDNWAWSVLVSKERS